MLALIIRKARALPRFRLATIGCAIALLLTLALPIVNMPNLYGAPGTYFGITGHEVAGGGWVAFFVVILVLFEVLRFFGRLKRFAGSHDRVVTLVALLVFVFGVQVCLGGFQYMPLAGPGWGFVFVALTTAGVAASLVLMGRDRTPSRSLRAWMELELRQAREELRGTDGGNSTPSAYPPPPPPPPPTT